MAAVRAAALCISYMADNMKGTVRFGSVFTGPVLVPPVRFSINFNENRVSGCIFV